MNAVNFCGINFRCLGQEHLHQLFNEDKETRFVVTVNSEFIVKANQNQKFLDLINDNYATFDGQIPYVFARIINAGQRFYKISGSDLIYDACAYAQEHGKSIFLLGGDPASNDLAVKQLREKYGIRMDGYSPPYQPYPFSDSHNEAILEKIHQFKPDFLFVGFGAEKQEYWISDNIASLQQNNVRFAVGCGGTFDFVSGKVRRAPVFLQKAGFEGVWRFLAEPSLFRLKRLLLSVRFFAVFYGYHIVHNRAVKA